MVNLADFIRLFVESGIAGVILPFFLFFIILFAVFEKSKVLGQDKKSLNMAISIVIALIVVIPHLLGMYPEGWDVVEMFYLVLPYFAILFIGLICTVVVASMFGGEINWKMIIAALIILELIVPETLIFGFIFARYFPVQFNAAVNSSVTAFLIMLLVFVVLVGFITKEEKVKKSD